MFELRNANVRYNDRTILGDVSLRIGAGERVALVGKSGAGKSTLLKLLFQQQRSGVALIPQELALVRVLSVFHNIYMGRLNRHRTWYNLLNLVRPARKEVDSVRRVVCKLGFEENLFTPVGELSGGQQQRTAVGRALYQGGEVLLGDEPVAAVDEHQARFVLESINAAHETVVLAMHDVSLALAYTNRVVGLKNGRIVLDEPTSALKPSDLDFLYKT